MNDLLELITLQGLDDELDRIRTRIAGDEARLADNHELVELRSRMETLDAALAALRTRQRRAEGSIEDLSARIEREEKKLYDGSIKQFKELQALEGDIGHVKDERRQAEDGMLEILTEIEGLEGERAEVATDLAALEVQWDEVAVSLTTEIEQLSRERTSVEAARTDRAGVVSAASLRLYEALRARKGGRAVAAVQGASCGACRVMLPDSLRRHIFNSPTLVQCPQCERILSAG